MGGIRRTRSEPAAAKPAAPKRPTKPAAGHGYGAIRADELLPVREMMRRLGWQRKTLYHARRCGLRIIPFGRLTYCLGADVLAFFGRLADDQAGNPGPAASNGKKGEA